MTRPYIGSSASDLKTLFEANQDNLDVLKDILYELGFRKTKGARKLIAQIEQRIAGLRDDDEEDAFDKESHDEDSKCSVIEEHKAPKVDEGKQPAGGARGLSLFGRASQDYELPPDDVQRPNNLSRIRPPGTSGLPSAYQKTLDQDFSLSLSEDAGPVDRYISALGALIAEIKRTGSGESMTRVVNEGLAQTIAAAISKRRTSAEKAVSAVAEPENPRCPECQSRTSAKTKTRSSRRSSGTKRSS